MSATDKRLRSSSSDTDINYQPEKQARLYSPVASVALNDQLYKVLGEMKQDIIGSINKLAEEVNTNTCRITEQLNRNNVLEDELSALKLENSHLKQTVAILEARQTRTEEALVKLQAEVLDSQRRQMLHNLVFYGAPEMSRENTLSTVMDIMTKKMKIPSSRLNKPGTIKGDISLDIAHRMGKSGSQHGPRPIVLKLVDRHSRDEVLKFVKNLKGSNISVAEQYPGKIRAKRAALVPELKRQKGLGNAAHIRIDRLVVEGNEVPSTERRNPVLPSEKTKASEPVKPTKFAEPVTQYISGNKFLAVATQVEHREDLVSAKSQLLLLPDAHTATHIMYAYKLNSVIGYDEDGEFGAHTSLLPTLRERDNIFISVLRWSGRQLGEKRFEKIQEVATEAITNLYAEDQSESELDVSETW